MVDTPDPLPLRRRVCLPPQADSKRGSGNENGHPAPDVGAGPTANSDDERDLILVRAMVNAAKSDGQIDSAEPQAMIDQLHNPTAAAIPFLRDEFRKPRDVRDFAMSVPIGMEQRVYTLSLIAIDLDTRKEANDRMERAQGPRIPIEDR